MTSTRRRRPDGSYAPPGERRAREATLALAALAAGTLSTVVQVLLWRALGADWLSLLLRDARLAAALLLGTGVLPPPATFDAAVMAAATAVHFALSVAYAALLAPLARVGSAATAAGAGALFGLALYAVNLHGFTAVFPWFAPARGGATLAAHIVFGLTAALVWQRAGGRRL
jgi:hypothetical protein